MAKKKEVLTVTPAPTFEEIMGAVDKERIAEAILATDPAEGKLDQWDFEDAKKCVWNAGEKWLVRDLGEFTFDGPEKEVFLVYPGATIPFHGFLDISGTVKGTIKPFKEFAGCRYVIDWKTTGGNLDTVWRNRLIESWQWMDYAVAHNAAVCLYRGMDRRGGLAEIILKVPPTTQGEVFECLSAVNNQIKSIKTFDVWPRNKPFACKAYGRDCEYLEDCNTYSMPRGVPEDHALSYSTVGDFMLCNEKARRKLLAKQNLKPGAGTDETNFGKAVHRGLANLWTQAYKL